MKDKNAALETNIKNDKAVDCIITSECWYISLQIQLDYNVNHK